MTFTKIALVAALMTGAAMPAQAATMTFTGRGLDINLQLLSPTFTLESVVYDISYDLGATFVNQSSSDQIATFSGFLGASPFGFDNFATSQMVPAGQQTVGFSTSVRTNGTLMGSALGAFYGSDPLTITPTGSLTSSLGRPTGGRTIANYTVTYSYDLITAAVPELSTWALMLAGFGMVGYSLRRKRPTLALA